MLGPMLWAGNQAYIFAVPVSVNEQYAKTVPGILRAHEQICAQVRKTVEENSKANALIKFCEPWPDPRSFKLHSICEVFIKCEEDPFDI